jgi:hypothetical protein
MKNIYLDYNIVVALMDQRDPKLNDFIAAIDRSKYLLVYSPAHIEEIAVARMRLEYSTEGTTAKLNFLSNLTGNMELLPVGGPGAHRLGPDGILLREEHPTECYRRVIAGYAGNDVAEAIEENVLREATENNIFDNDPNEMNNVQFEEVLADPMVRLQIHERFFLGMLAQRYTKQIAKQFIDTDFVEIGQSFVALRTLTTVVFNQLEAIRYHPEKVENSRSRMHDVSHAIYASACKVLVSQDKKLVAKCRAAYSFMGIDTQVMKLQEFQGLDLSRVPD